MATKKAKPAELKLVASDAEHGDSPDGVASSRRRGGRWISIEEGKVAVGGKHVATLDGVLGWDADDTRIVAAVDIGTYGSLVEIPIAGGKPRTIFTQQVHRTGVAKLESVAIGPGGEIVTGSLYHLMLLGPDHVLAHEMKETATSLWRVGDALIVSPFDRAKIVYRIRGGKLKRGERIANKDVIYAVWTEAGRWYAELDDGVVEIR